MSDNNFKKLGIAPRFHEILSTGLYTGLLPGAPGTYAAFVALVIWYLLYLVLSPPALTLTTLALIVVTTVVGAWTSSVMERYWGPDPRAVVIDEYVGCWIPLLVAPAGEYTWIFALAGFALFRIIDITKPLGCRRIEQVCPGGWGVMMDDVLAGSYALIIVYILKLLFL
ncbi:MAG: phosphatidylglycerophosphatase A [Paenibacillus sp.]|nr:phosphatidylglycerophosphatase A [Paenibacillus sp.]